MNVGVESTWFTTGNPFVDTGQEMMAAMAEVHSAAEMTTADVKALLPRLVDLYFQDGWIKSSYTIFPNSALNNFALGNESKRRARYTSVLNEWLRAIEEPGNHVIDATCAISGRPAHTRITKVYLPMSDFGGGNFQSSNEGGLPLAAPVALALQFFPLGLVKVGKMMALPHFSNDDVQALWADKRIKNVTGSEALSTGGVPDVGTSRPANAFFKLVENLVSEQRGFSNSSVTLYLFNNFNQADYKNASELHYMPSPVFRFIQSAMTPTAEGSWRRVVRRGYMTRKEIEDESDALRRYENLVYSKLLKGESISGFFLDRKRRCPVVRGDGGWRLYGSYLREVVSMDQRRIDNLRDLGDRIAPLVRDKTRRLMALEGARSKGALTDILYRITKDSALRDRRRPLITFDQLVTDIFPHDLEYSDWREVKFLLLFRIYEQLFDELKEDPEYIRADENSGEEGAVEE